MCGIAGLYTKTPALQAVLGEHLSRMLEQLSFRGPDSAGVAFYRDPAPAGSCKISLCGAGSDADWTTLGIELAEAFGDASEPRVRATHAVFVVEDEAANVQAWLAENHPELRLMSAGSSIEIYKQAGQPRDFVRRFEIDRIDGTHALGHTRMATESRVTTEHSHPFSTGLDLCLVHNGSLSNHNRLRAKLRREGLDFQTDNDSEVAAGYLTWRMREGASLEQALEGCLHDLDGFYTFAVASADGFAVLRDPIACKPAVMAETDEWVAIASEYRAIAVLPGAEDAVSWEPDPGRVYIWGPSRPAVPTLVA
ncbi:MAG TPA: hypothetical protein VGX72_08005 [Solirubrobacteraceae bacterium]|jgi:glutamate synthase domain-containing protein 1|nr:hypothetical protein [Solirubrobacteraceae bacterium]